MAWLSRSKRFVSGHGLSRADKDANIVRARPYETEIFPDGRPIVKGTSNTRVARSLYPRYVG